jgi:hypothetical protein
MERIKPPDRESMILNVKWNEDGKTNKKKRQNFQLSNQQKVPISGRNGREALFPTIKT